VATSNLSGEKRESPSMGTKKADNNKNIKLPLDRKTLVTEAQTKWLKKFMTQKQMEDIRGEFVVTEK